VARKKSIKTAAKAFQDAANEINEYFNKTSGLDAKWHSWCTDYAVIRLYSEFELLMLSALVGAINNDTTTLSDAVGLNFPAHLSQDVCTFLIVGRGYFDFKGRDGLIRIIKQFVPDDHYLVTILKDAEYRESLEQLSALRDFGAHRSSKAKKAARKAIGGERIGSSGSWLNKQNRFGLLCENLKKLSHAIEKKAAY
jgi:hypothetical protein